MFDPCRVDLLVVDDDAEFRATVVRRLSRRGFAVTEAANGNDALKLTTRREFDVVVLDLVLPDSSGLEVLEKLRADANGCEVVMLTGQGSIETAVRAMKLGAYDYLTKPFPLSELEIVIQKAYERRQLAKENRQLRVLLERGQPRWEIVGNSPVLHEVFRLIERAGPSDQAVLIQGESGTGKELVARALHRVSPRAEFPLVAMNCASVSESLLESELFGHEKGSFTGADRDKPGLFELADGGTLFIDEIGEMPLAMQAKLLRILEDGSMRRVGSLQERRVNVRLLSATNRDLAEAVRSKHFREDLYYRINVVTIHLPPLRDRRGDIPLLVSQFLGPDWTIDAEALKALETYRWPGNVRQLINVIERAKILGEGQTIGIADLPAEVTQTSASHGATTGSGIVVSSPDDLREIERAKIIEVLQRENGNKSRAARSLGITRRSLYRLLEKHAIESTTSSPNGHH